MPPQSQGGSQSVKRFAKSMIESLAPGLVNAYLLYVNRKLEPELIILHTMTDRSRISIDVGANIGLYCKALLPISSSVVAFEPLGKMQRRLRSYFGDRITLYTCALSDTAGTAVIRQPARYSGLATIETRNTLELVHSEIETTVIETRTLDSFAFRDVGFIKIDVEGHEETVLVGAKNTIIRCRPNLLIESEDRHNPGVVQRIISYLESLDYDASFLDNGRLRPIDQFDVSVDQNIENVGLTGKTGRYVNNFIFKPRPTKSSACDSGG